MTSPKTNIYTPWDILPNKEMVQSLPGELIRKDVYLWSTCTCFLCVAFTLTDPCSVSICGHFSFLNHNGKCSPFTRRCRNRKYCRAHQLSVRTIFVVYKQYSGNTFILGYCIHYMVSC